MCFGIRISAEVPLTERRNSSSFVLSGASTERSSVGPELASVVTPIARKRVADGGVIGFLSLSEAVA
jgi:hypothetical protein